MGPGWMHVHVGEGRGPGAGLTSPSPMVPSSLELNGTEQSPVCEADLVHSPVFLCGISMPT